MELEVEPEQMEIVASKKRCALDGKENEKKIQKTEFLRLIQFLDSLPEDARLDYLSNMVQQIPFLNHDPANDEEKSNLLRNIFANQLVKTSNLHLKKNIRLLMLEKPTVFGVPSLVEHYASLLFANRWNKKLKEYYEPILKSLLEGSDKHDLLCALYLSLNNTITAQHTLGTIKTIACLAGPGQIEIPANNIFTCFSNNHFHNAQNIISRGELAEALFRPVGYSHFPY